MAMTRNATSSPLMDARITSAMVTDGSVSYRPGRPEDAPGLMELVARCDTTILDWAPEGYSLPEAEFEADSSKLAGLISASDTWVIVAAGEDGGPVGFASFRAAEGAGRGYISNLFVDPAHWGAGTGRGLLARAEQGMRERGWSIGELNTQSLNARARELYERAGWRDTGG